MDKIERDPIWTAVDAAVVGRSHVQLGTVCQDRTCILQRGGILAAALADGAGSASRSELGAEAVTRRICELLCDRFDAFRSNPSGAEVKQEILRQLYEALSMCCQQHGCELQDLASTLLAIAVRDDSYLLLHIGDGVIGYVKNGQIRVASTPDNGEYANETTFVTSPNALTALRISKGTDSAIEGFVLMSDGCEASLYSRRQKILAPILSRLVYRLGITSAEFLRPSLEQSLQETIRKKTMDDCSLLLAAKVLRSYRDLTPEELDDYFLLEELEPEEKALRRETYKRLLDLLDAPRSAAALAEHFPGEDAGSFEAAWLAPLEELGYVRRTEDNQYARTVGATELPGGTKQNEEDQI